MAKTLNVKVQGDHIESLTSVSGATALMELIWNSLDADSSEINIATISNALGPESIEITDNGHGMTYERATEAFENLGGSQKKRQKFSPNNRAYHGEEGKGRYRAFGLGNLIVFKSFYKDNGQSKFFEINLERSGLTQPAIGDLLTRKQDSKTGVQIIIQNLDVKKVNKAFSPESIAWIEEKLALYYQQYPTFNIKINGKVLDFKSLIVNEHSENLSLGKNSKIRIVEWGSLFNKAEARHQYLKEKLNYNISEDKEGLELLNARYKEYLPNELVCSETNS